MDYSFILGRSPPATPGRHRCEFPFGGCTGWGRGGLVSPEVSFMTFLIFKEKKGLKMKERRKDVFHPIATTSKEGNGGGGKSVDDLQ